MSNARTARQRFGVVSDRPKIISPYIRVSALMGRMDEAFRSPDLQRGPIVREILAAGHIVGPTFSDIDKTGTDFNRSGIQDALAAKARGEIDGIAVFDVSRVGRTASETLEVIERFRLKDGAFLSSRERIDESPEGEMQLGNFVLWAQYQSHRIAAGWQAVLVARAEEGRHNGTPPFGYRFETVGEKFFIVADPVTAPYVVEAFHRYDGGESAASLFRWLRSCGVVRSTSHVNRMLRNPFYVGQVRLYVYEGKPRKRTRRDDVPPFETKGIHEAILLGGDGEPDFALFQRVQARLAKATVIPKRYVTPVHALGGLAKCEHCGRSLVFQACTTTSRGLPRYRCVNGQKHGCRGVGSPVVVDVEDEVLRQVEREIDGMLASTTAPSISKRATAAADRDKIEAAIERTKRKQTDADFGLSEADESSPKTARLRERHERLTERYDAMLDTLYAALDALEPYEDGPTADEAVEAATALVQRWPTATPAERCAMLRACGVVRVTVAHGEGWRPAIDATRVSVHFSF